MLTTYETDRKLNHDIMERKEQKARPVTAHNAMRDETEQDKAVQQLRKLRELTAVTQLERQQATLRRERHLERMGFFVNNWHYIAGTLTIALYVAWLFARDVSFEQAFLVGGGR